MVRNDISVDWNANPRIVTILAPSTSVTMQDLYDTLRVLEADPSNMDNDFIVSGSGKENLGGGVFVGLTITLSNAQLAFEDRPGPFFVQCNATGGNLVAVDENGNVISSIYPTSYTQVILTSSSSATLQELEAIQFSSYNNMVVLDLSSGYSGVNYPIGTHMAPVNNLTDAKTIAYSKAFDIIHIQSDLFIPSGENIDEFTFTSSNWLSVTIDSSVSSINTNFEKISLHGEMSGFWNVLIDCWVYDVSNFCGWMRGGSFTNVALAPYTFESAGQSFFDNIMPMYPNLPTTLVMNTNVAVSFTNAADIYEIKNMTAGSIVTMGIGRGEVIIDNSCVGGIIIVSGLSSIQNNSPGGITLIDNTVTEDGIWNTNISSIIDPSTAGYSLWNMPKKVVNKIIPFLFAK